MSFLLDSTLVGSGLVLAVLVFQSLGKRRLAPKWLALAWVLISIRFLLPVPADLPGAIPVVPAGQTLTERLGGAQTEEAAVHGNDIPGSGGKRGLSSGLFILWAAGAAVSASVLLAQAARLRRILRERQSTDHDLLELLESAKTRLRIHSPIGLILSEQANAPMIVGWLRPRIVLPASFPRGLSDPEITRILVHELSHFKSADVLALWLAAIVRVVHWYNPLAYVVVNQLRARQEEACDARAMAALQESGQAYGKGLLDALRMVRADRGPSVGALAAVSSFRDMQGRIRLLASRRRFSSSLSAAMILFLAALSLVTTTARASFLPGAAARMALRDTETWLMLLDQGQFAESWETASPRFKGPIPERGWVSNIARVRSPLGQLRNRRLHNQTFLPVNPEGLRGPFIVTVFDSEFERMPFALETVTSVLDEDGQWRTSAYFIRPGQ
jgi:Antirepressor regulating drug resistance, predicted signal transduction N-terminal membrane component